MALGRIRLQGGPFAGDEMEEEAGQDLLRYGSDGRRHRYAPTSRRELGGAVVFTWEGAVPEESAALSVMGGRVMTESLRRDRHSGRRHPPERRGQTGRSAACPRAA